MKREIPIKSCPINPNQFESWQTRTTRTIKCGSAIAPFPFERNPNLPVPNQLLVWIRASPTRFNNATRTRNQTCIANIIKSSTNGAAEVVVCSIGLHWNIKTLNSLTLQCLLDGYIYVRSFYQHDSNVLVKQCQLVWLFESSHDDRAVKVPANTITKKQSLKNCMHDSIHWVCRRCLQCKRLERYEMRYVPCHYQYTYNRNIYQRYASSRCCRLTSTLMKFEQFDIHRIMMGCDVCWLFGCVKDDARVHWPGTAEQRVFCCVGYPF